jgi:hypothetical protein
MDVHRTSGGMTGDSSVAMARVFYVDALSLRRVNDAATFSRMLSTMQADQSRNTWMAERYTCEGLASHDPFYHEYPEVIAMVLQKVKYGITVLLDRVEVLPWIALFPAAGKPGAAGADGSRAHRGPLASSLRYQLSGMLVEYMVEDSDEGSSIRVVIQRGCDSDETPLRDQTLPGRWIRASADGAASWPRCSSGSARRRW